MNYVSQYFIFRTVWSIQSENVHAEARPLIYNTVTPKGHWLEMDGDDG